MKTYNPVLLLLSVVVALAVTELLFRIFHDSDFWLGMKIKIELVKAKFLMWCIESHSPLAWLSRKTLFYTGMLVSKKTREKVRLMKKAKAKDALACAENTEECNES